MHANYNSCRSSVVFLFYCHAGQASRFFSPVFASCISTIEPKILLSFTLMELKLPSFVSTPHATWSKGQLWYHFIVPKTYMSSEIMLWGPSTIEAPNRRLWWDYHCRSWRSCSPSPSPFRCRLHLYYSCRTSPSVPSSPSFLFSSYHFHYPNCQQRNDHTCHIWSRHTFSLICCCNPCAPSMLARIS